MDDASLDASLKGLFDAVAGQLERAVWGDTGRLRHLALLLQRAIGRTVRQLREHARRSQFEPLGMEVSFGLPGSPRPALDLGPIIIRGVIDRIDAALVEGCLLLRVMDYKTGQPQFSLAKVAQGVSLQLPLYLAAVLQFARELAIQAGLTGPEVRDVQVRVAAMFLFPVQDPMVVMDDWDEVELAKALAKRWRPSGVVLDDPHVVLMLDEEAADAASQRILPVKLTKAGAVSGQGTVSQEQMAMLGAYATQAARLTAARLQGGDTALRPYRDANRRACEICDYHALCTFDPQLPGNVYRDLPSMPAAQAWAQIRAALAPAAGEEDQ
jgi:ATP-dependent helicase/nuclease subunit B